MLIKSSVQISVLILHCRRQASKRCLCCRWIPSPLWMETTTCIMEQPLWHLKQARKLWKRKDVLGSKSGSQQFFLWKMRMCDAKNKSKWQRWRVGEKMERVLWLKFWWSKPYISCCLGLLFPFCITSFYTDLDVLQGFALNVHYEKMASADPTTISLSFARSLSKERGMVRPC